MVEVWRVKSVWFVVVNLRAVS